MMMIDFDDDFIESEREGNKNKTLSIYDYLKDIKP